MIELPNFSTVGERVAHIRQIVRMEGKELARRAGISTGALNDLERGRSRTSTFLPMIAATLGCDPVWLQTGKTASADWYVQLLKKRDAGKNILEDDYLRPASQIVSLQGANDTAFYGGHIQANSKRRVPMRGEIIIRADGTVAETVAFKEDAETGLSHADPSAYFLKIRLVGEFSPGGDLRNGWMMLMTPTWGPILGAMVLARLADGRTLARRLISELPDSVTLESLDRNRTTLSVDRSDLKSMVSFDVLRPEP